MVLTGGHGVPHAKQSGGVVGCGGGGHQGRVRVPVGTPGRTQFEFANELHQTIDHAIKQLVCVAVPLLHCTCLTVLGGLGAGSLRPPGAGQPRPNCFDLPPTDCAAASTSATNRF